MIYVKAEALDRGQSLYMYCSYIDDNFMCTNSVAELEKFRNRLQDSSGLAFSIELSNNNRISYI